MKQKRNVIGSQSTFFPSGAAFTVPEAGTASATSKPDASDPAWIALGPIKWSLEPNTKTETHMVPSPGTYVPGDEIQLTVGISLKGKLEQDSNLSRQLQEATQTLPVSPTAGGVYNPYGGPANIKGWLHIQEYDQFNTLINTVDRYVSLKVTGATNKDDKASETPIEALVLFNTLNVGDLT